MPSYRLLAHEEFLQQRSEFKARNPAADGRALDTVLRTIAINPESAGSRRLHDLSDHSLRGRLYRIWVRGRQGYRLVYLTARAQGSDEEVLVLPLYVTMEKRKGIDWGEIAETVVALAAIVERDLRANEMTQFRQLGL